MRVWDIPVNQLCNKHLIAQHHEIHCICSINLHGYSGFYNHPETRRWRGHLAELAYKHYQTMNEMLSRGIHHHYHLGTIDDVSMSTNQAPEPWQPVNEQLNLLQAKGCSCRV
jgi:hypothetical protein